VRIDLDTCYPNLVLFAGTTPNIGTTSCAFSMAATLAQGAPHLTVAYLCLNLKSSKIARYLGLSEADQGLSAMRVDLKARTLTSERLDQYVSRLRRFPNLRVLNGNMQREQAELYMPEDIEHLLAIASQTYDICVVDCNAYWDNAATIISVMRAGVRLLVTTPALDAFQDDLNGWLIQAGSLFGVMPQQFQLIVTQSARHTDEYRASDVGASTGLDVVGTVPYDRQLASDMQLGQLHEWCDSKRSLSLRRIEQIAGRIAAQLGIVWSAKGEPRKQMKLPFRSLKRQVGVNG